ncbi:MAG: helix-turn-helix transcriptional regulator [Candidatus Dormibacteraeota bacterium]|uniref:Helix-turn-helix transcriptional regulator n=1 Tax=Candidatus Nephthysia bennettiae TaxID=3127016 RepID=A0A934KEL3_9BACT|nr:helix-turn-helix transcriptional regulator [Candidatus Dormibacteraeota bacterium]
MPSILLLLTKGPAHGYELLNELPAIFPRSGPPPDAGAFYRTLRALEEEGSLRSSWAHPSSGPSRRVYELTERGRLELERSAAQMAGDLEHLQRFLAAYEAAGARVPNVPPQRRRR